MSGTDETMAMGDGGDATVGGDGDHDDDSGDGRKWWLIPLGIVFAGVIIGAGIAVAGSGGDDKEKADDTTTTSTSTSTSTSTTSAPPAPSGGGGGGGGAPSDDPRIDSFSANKSSPANCTPSAPDVSGPTAPNYVAVTLSWTTQNTDSVAFYQNGGLYQNFGGGNGSINLTPGCSDDTYSWEIRASGPNGPTATRSITFEINNTTT